MYYNDLVAPMIAHGLYDFVALVYLSRKARRGQVNVTATPTEATSEDPTRQRDE
jgi:hypothetical protein